MNRKVAFGIAVFVAVLGVAMFSSDNSANAGLFGCGGSKCDGGLFNGHRCHGPLLKRGCHGGGLGLLNHCGGKKHCGGGLLARLKARKSCCAPAPCCEPAPAPCCEPAPAPCCEPAPAPCCEPAPAPCCEPAPAPCCEPAPAPCCGGGEIVGEEVIISEVPVEATPVEVVPEVPAAE